MIDKLLDNPEKKFQLLAKIILYIGLIGTIINLLNYILSGIQAESNTILYFIYGIISSSSLFIAFWAASLILLWFSNTYKKH